MAVVRGVETHRAWGGRIKRIKRNHVVLCGSIRLIVYVKEIHSPMTMKPIAFAFLIFNFFIDVDLWKCHIMYSINKLLRFVKKLKS